MEYPLISVITTVYNASSTLEATLKSVLNQKKELFEYIIIDGGSKDASLEIIHRYQDQLGSWVSEHDEGIFDAMNKGIDRARGDWLYFLGADDLMCGAILAKIAPYLKSELSVVYGNVLLDNGYVYRSHIGLRCLFENRLHHQGAFYHKRLFENFRYEQKFNICADYELTLRIYLQEQPTLYVPETITIFAMGGNSNNLTSDDINNIRGIYLKSSYLNAIFSSMLNLYYFYIRAKRLLRERISKISFR